MNRSLKYSVQLARATDYVLMASLASVACGFAILALIIVARQDGALKSEYSTWESTLAALRKDCDRMIRGGEVFITNNKQQPMITVQCNDRKGRQVVSYRLHRSGVNTGYSVQAFHDGFMYARN
ncbi:MAG: hypothetical protein JXQ99_20660 [Hyphomicrobiaceae bacterium]